MTDKYALTGVSMLLALAACGGGGGGGGGGSGGAGVPTVPSFSSNPTNEATIVSSTASFRSVVTGTPTPTLQWQISTNGGVSFADIPSATTSDYTAPAALVGDSGTQFRVVATNGLGAAISNIATLTVVQSIAVPETGQTTCYAGGAVVNCAGTGQDGDLKAGVAWPNPRFAVGTGAEADCVTDNLTGLMWLRSPSVTQVNWATALSNSNSLNICGYSDWRLPNRKEMRSLANAGSVNNAATLNSSGFSNVRSGSYWTSSNNGTSARVLVMNDRFVFSNTKTSTNYYWPARGDAPAAVAALAETGESSCYDATGGVISCAGAGQDAEIRAGVALPSQRFAIGTGAEAGCVTDPLTGLMWVQAPSTTASNWDTALSYANNLVFCGYSDWRLPNMNELESISNSDAGAGYLNARGFSNIQAGYYWSSTAWLLAGSNDTAMAFLFNGYEISDFKSVSYYVLPVRAGQ